MFTEQTNHGLFGMCIEIVHNQSYPVDVFIPLCKLLDEAGKVIARAPLGDFGEVATRLWLDRAKHIARALAFVFVVHFPHFPGDIPEGGRT